MPNRIRQLQVFPQRLNPAEAELLVSVYPDELTAGTEVRGRLMGPHCCYTTTVEVAYPLREMSRQYQKEDVPHFTMRVVIPEPSFWDPQCPFLYQGPVELWHRKERCDQRTLIRGLRTFSLSSGGLRWNGRPLTIRGVQRSHCTEEEGLALHAQGYNALLAPVAPESAALWELADRLGFLMLGRIESRKQIAATAELRSHPSCLGWILVEEFLHDPMFEPSVTALSSLGAIEPCLVGMELLGKPTEPLPGGVRLILCQGQILPDLVGVDLPKLLVGTPPGFEPELGPNATLGLIST